MATGARYQQPGGYPPNCRTLKGFPEIRLCIIGEGVRYSLPATGSRRVVRHSQSTFPVLTQKTPRLTTFCPLIDSQAFA